MMLTRAARTRNLARKRSRRKIAVRRRQRSSQPRTVARLLLPRSKTYQLQPWARQNRRQRGRRDTAGSQQPTTEYTRAQQEQSKKKRLQPRRHIVCNYICFAILCNVMQVCLTHISVYLPTCDLHRRGISKAYAETD